MSPAAKTPGRLVRICVSTVMWRFSSSSPQSAIGPILAMKPSAATTVWAGSTRTLPSFLPVTSTSSSWVSPRSAVTSHGVSSSIPKSRA